MSKILVITDAWTPQVNGVVTSLKATVSRLRSLYGHEVVVVHPGMFWGFPLPGYAEIKVCPLANRRMHDIIKTSQADFIHIAVEGPLGKAAKRSCSKLGLRYTTAYHTMFPEYINKRLGIPLKYSYKYIREFHNSSSGVMVVSPAVRMLLQSNGVVADMPLWSRGVDTTTFFPRPKGSYPQEYALYVGRVSHEKNIEAFLEADTDLVKIVIGDGPQLQQLKTRHRDALFLGTKRGEELARWYSGAAVFAFPSVTDTFGLVMIESLACGVPVAALTGGSAEGIITEDIGCVSDNMTDAMLNARRCDSAACVAAVRDRYTWEAATGQFMNNLVSV